MHYISLFPVILELWIVILCIYSYISHYKTTSETFDKSSSQTVLILTNFFYVVYNNFL